MVLGFRVREPHNIILSLDGRYDEFQIADGLRRYGWTVPAYTMAPDAQSVTLLRVVVREDFSRSLADRFMGDLKRTLATLDAHPPKLVQAVIQAIQEDSPEKSVEELEKAAAIQGTSFHGSAKKHAEEHAHRRHAKAHKKHSIHKTNGVC